jgi:type VI secretion system protein ImpI/type VI secretion system protein
MLRCPDGVPPATRHLELGQLSIGRGTENDWVTPDPDKSISRFQCVVALQPTGWALADVSNSGTFLNREGQPVGKGQIRPLTDGDRITFGAYEIEVRIAAAISYAPPPLTNSVIPGFPFDDPFAPPRQAAPAPPPLSEVLRAPPEALPPDQYPLSTPRVEAPFGGNITAADHSQFFDDVFDPGPAPPLRDDEWGAPAPTPATAPASPERVKEWWEATAITPPALAPIPPRSPPPPPGVGASPPAPEPPAPTPTKLPGQDLLAGFLTAAGMAHERPPADPAAAMANLGAAFRAIVIGIRQVLRARTEIKNEFRISRTEIQPRNANPLKFSIDDDDALRALLGLGRPVNVPPATAIEDALRDMRLHELATITAMQAAVRLLLERLDPARVDQTGNMAVLPMQRKARAFDAYEKLYATLRQAMNDDFDSVFGKEFARAYETSLAELNAKAGRL